MNASLALKANIEDVNAGLALKANIEDVNADLALKANIEDVNADLALRSLKTVTDAILSKQLVQDFFSVSNTAAIAITATSTAQQNLATFSVCGGNTVDL